MLALLLECLPQQVALPTEGVDRNQKGRADDELLLVALPTEGVDRNMAVLGDQSHGTKSPSPRRAWIEISFYAIQKTDSETVALPTEGVDRNCTTG